MVKQLNLMGHLTGSEDRQSPEKAYFFNRTDLHLSTAGSNSES